MTSTLIGIATALFLAIGGFIGHWIGSRNKTKAVEQAKADTETQVRADVATETAAVATQAATDATASRADTDTQAAVVAAQGGDALDDALKAQGQLRD